MLRMIGTALVLMFVVLGPAPALANGKDKMCMVQVPCDQLKSLNGTPLPKVKAEIMEIKVCLSDEDWANCSGRWYASTKKGEKSDYFFEQCGVIKRPAGHDNFSWKNRNGYHYVFRFNAERR
jgi:hypothetical protein